MSDRVRQFPSSTTRAPNQDYADHHFAGVHRLQAAQLQHDQEQAEDDRQVGVQEILPVVSHAHGASGVEIDTRAMQSVVKSSAAPRPGRPPGARGALAQASSSIGRAAVSKTTGWGFDSLLACQPKTNQAPDDRFRLVE